MRSALIVVRFMVWSSTKNLFKRLNLGEKNVKLASLHVKRKIRAASLQGFGHPEERDGLGRKTRFRDIEQGGKRSGPTKDWPRQAA
jgi:hypothetical protein